MNIGAAMTGSDSWLRSFWAGDIGVVSGGSATAHHACSCLRGQAQSHKWIVRMDRIFQD
jgi:hypothetical protein